MTKPSVGYRLNEKESSLIPTIIEFFIENDQVQKINEVFIETQTPVIIDTLFTHNEVPSMIVILSVSKSVCYTTPSPAEELCYYWE